MNVKKSPQKMRTFLAEYVVTKGNFSSACVAADISRQTAYSWLQNDEEFAADFDKARISTMYSVEDEIVRRGVEGYEEPVYYAGVIVGTKPKYSDQLLVYRHQMLQAANNRREALNKSSKDRLAGMSKDAIAARLQQILHDAAQRREKRLQEQCEELV